MLRSGTVRTLLLEDVAALRPRKGSDETPSVALRRARRRALFMAGLDWAAILALFLLRQEQSSFLVVQASEYGLFSLAILAIATHAGFRLGQSEKYAAVQRALDELPESSE